MQSRGLQLTLQKTEIVLLTGRRISTVVPMSLGDEQVETKRSARYLGVTLDNKLFFWDHISRVSNRTMERVASLSRLMANVNGPSPCKRRLLMSTTHSIMLYGAEVWAEALQKRKYKKVLARVQRRGALRIASAYNTVSEQAVLVIAGVIPIDLLANERRRIYNRGPGISRDEAAEAERGTTIARWVDRWKAAGDVAIWTRRLLRNPEAWIERRWGCLLYTSPSPRDRTRSRMPSSA